MVIKGKSPRDNRENPVRGSEKHCNFAAERYKWNLSIKEYGYEEPLMVL